MAIYFVTTTLSTCGYGDINASLPQDEDGSYNLDAQEAAAMLLLQFFGMLFYSLTIEKVQSLMINGSIPHTEYSNQMVDVIENLIVKVSQHLPAER